MEERMTKQMEMEDKKEEDSPFDFLPNQALSSSLPLDSKAYLLFSCIVIARNEQRKILVIYTLVFSGGPPFVFPAGRLFVGSRKRPACHPRSLVSPDTSENP